MCELIAGGLGWFVVIGVVLVILWLVLLFWPFLGD